MNLAWPPRPIRIIGMAGVHLSDVAESVDPARDIANVRSRAGMYPEPLRSEILAVANRCEKALQDAQASSEATAGDHWAKLAAWNKAVTEAVMPCIAEAKAIFDRPQSEFLLLKERARSLVGPAALQIQGDVALCENVVNSRQTDAVKRSCLSSLARRIMEAEAGGVVSTPQPVGAPPGPMPPPTEPEGIPTLALVGGGSLIAIGLAVLLAS